MSSSPTNQESVARYHIVKGLLGSQNCEAVKAFLAHAMYLLPTTDEGDLANEDLFSKAPDQVIRGHDVIMNILFPQNAATGGV